MEKRKAVGADTIGKRVKLSSGRAPLSKTSGSKGEKASAKTVDVILMGMTPMTQCDVFDKHHLNRPNRMIFSSLQDQGLL